MALSIAKIIASFRRDALPFPGDVGMSMDTYVTGRYVSDLAATIDATFNDLEGTLGSVERRLDTVTQEITLLPTEVFLAAGTVCVLSVNGKMIPAKADEKVRARGLMGIVVEDTPGNVEGRFLLRGKYREPLFDDGDILYVSTTEGVLSARPPEGQGDIVRVVGYKLANGDVFFDPDQSYFEVE